MGGLPDTAAAAAGHGKRIDAPWLFSGEMMQSKGGQALDDE